MNWSKKVVEESYEGLPHDDRTVEGQESKGTLGKSYVGIPHGDTWTRPIFRKEPLGLLVEGHSHCSFRGGEVVEGLGRNS